MCVLIDRKRGYRLKTNEGQSFLGLRVGGKMKEKEVGKHE
jgi:hypothetical protein